jgi:lipopolysaccharide exporter
MPSTVTPAEESASPPEKTGNYWWRSAALTLLEKGSGMVFALGTSMLLLRALTKGEFATWGLFLIVTYFLEMGRNGLIQNGLVRYLALHRHDEREYREIATASLALNFVFSIVTNFVIWFGLDWFATQYQAPQLRVVLPVYLATNFVMALLCHANFVQQANFEFRGIFWSTFLQRGGLFAWIVLCELLGWPILLSQLAWALFAGSLLGAAASMLYARPFLRHGWPPDFRWMKRLAGYGKFVLGTNLSTMFYKNIDKLALGSLLGPAAFAIYDAAGKITQLVEAPSFSIAQVVFPQGAERMRSEGAAGIKRLYERSVAAVLCLILPFVVMVLLFAKPVVLLFAGAAYADSAEVLRITAFFGLFLPFAVQFGTILDSTGRPATNFFYTLFTAALNLGLSYVLIHQFGVLGAALASLVGYSISFVLMQRLLFRDFGIQWWRPFGYVPEIYRLMWEKVQARLGRKFSSGTPAQPVVNEVRHAESVVLATVPVALENKDLVN